MPDGISTFNYQDAFQGAIGFYGAQRSGVISDSRVPWRASSGLGDVPSGGFYEGRSKPPSPQTPMITGSIVDLS